MDSHDRDLVERARDGDPHARERLVERFASTVLRWARTECRDARDGEEVAQEVLLATARNLQQLEAAEAFPRWLRAVIHHQCQRHRRLRAGAPRSFEALDDPTDPHELPEDVAAREEAYEQIVRALETLEPQHREVIVLRDLEGWTAPEVAEQLSISVEAVKSRLHRARSALRDRLSL